MILEFAQCAMGLWGHSLFILNLHSEETSILKRSTSCPIPGFVADNKKTIMKMIKGLFSNRGIGICGKWECQG